jgi:hypothetical protein
MRAILAMLIELARMAGSYRRTRKAFGAVRNHRFHRQLHGRPVARMAGSYRRTRKAFGAVRNHRFHRQLHGRPVARVAGSYSVLFRRRHVQKFTLSGPFRSRSSRASAGVAIS